MVDAPRTPRPGGSWVPLLGAAGIVLTILLVVLLASLLGTSRASRLDPAPTSSSSADR